MLRIFLRAWLMTIVNHTSPLRQEGAFISSLWRDGFFGERQKNSKLQDQGRLAVLLSFALLVDMLF